MTYTGRTLGIGLIKGRPFAFYLLCSRSFPNRRAVIRGNAAYIINQSESNNPYVSYPVIRVDERYAVVANGLHTDFIFQALEWEKPRKALVHVLDSMDYERDEHGTPRIAGVIERGSGRGWLGFAGRDGFWVRELELREGKAFVTATYNLDGFIEISMGNFHSAKELATEILKLPLEHKILAIGVIEKKEGWEVEFAP
ncbi:IMP cyclohydrolase [Thermococcus waiotapuensis]|uniref:IMP cyclohydrolase n=1 Tax=Thermococcus waiotapuensis TaxID=90909 RepID=A0AAE4T368_9EURY|nr:IMP cyclohydrolase [Thermococcus waiotapuensis]MDV3103523.1 IMP cyclohydrolase [Thermococcus waiotapuensis]